MLREEGNKFITFRNAKFFRLMMNFIKHQVEPEDDVNFLELLEKNEKKMLLHELEFWDIKIDPEGKLYGALGKKFKPLYERWIDNDNNEVKYTIAKVNDTTNV